MIASRGLWQRLAFGAACVATLGILAYWIEDYRGDAAWDAYRIAARARGEKLEIADLLPTPVPDDQNFAASPVLRRLISPESDKVWDSLHIESLGGGYYLEEPVGKELQLTRDYWFRRRAVTDRNTNPEVDILQTLEPLDQMLQPLRRALALPFDQLRIDGTFAGWGSSFWSSYNSIRLADMLQLHADALLSKGDSRKAIADFELCERLAAMYRGLPSISSVMTSVFNFATASRIVRNGLELDRWSDADCADIEAILKLTDLRELAKLGLMSDRAFKNDYLDRMAASPRDQWAKMVTGDSSPPLLQRWYNWMPHGWIRQNQVRINQFFDQGLSDPPRGESWNHHATAMDYPYTFIAIRGFRHMEWDLVNAYSAQDRISTLRIALALRRYAYREGHYPDRLADVVPAFLPELPAISEYGDGIRYQRTATGVSLGTNERVLNLTVTK